MSSNGLVGCLSGIILYMANISAVHAIMMEAVFEGVVTSSFDATGSILGEAGSDHLVGTSVTTRFWYDSAEPVPDLNPSDPTLASYRYPILSNVDWIEASIDVGGMTFFIDPYYGSGNTLLDDKAFVYDGYSSPPRDGLFLEDRASYHHEDINGSESRNAYLYATFVEYIDDVIVGGVALPDYLIEWDNNDASDSGHGRLEIAHVVTDNAGGVIEYEYAQLFFDVASLRLSTVPEPPTIALIGIVLTGVSFTRKSRKRFAQQRKKHLAD